MAQVASRTTRPNEGLGTHVTETASAGWYPDPENAMQQRYWDGSAWTPHVSPASATMPTSESRFPSGQPAPPRPALQSWKTSWGFSVLGLLVGFPLLVSLGALLAIPLIIMTDAVTGNDAVSAPLGALVGNVLMLIYAAKFYPSYFTEKPLLKSNRAISFANVMFGNWIGFIWNGNLSKKTKGVSNVVLAVGSAVTCALLAFNVFGALSVGAISSSTNTPGNSSSNSVPPVDVGGVSVEVPAPANFVRLTPEMSELYALQSKFVPPNNEDLGCFISQGDAAAALAGEVPPLKRRFSVQVSRNIGSLSVSTSDFLEIKKTFGNDVEKRLSEVKDKLANPLADASAALSQYSEDDLELQFSDTVPFPAHVDDDRMFAFSMLQKAHVETEEGTSAFVNSCTTTALYVNQRVLFLYVFGAEDDLEWTREQSRNWAETILSANPE